jgi:transcriptional regulator with XRE-family HTH domain
MPTLTTVIYPSSTVNGVFSRETLNGHNANVGLTVRKLRRDKDISQTDMADKIGVSRQVYASYERGAVGISTVRLAAIADALEMPTSEILRLAEQTGPSIPVVRETPAKYTTNPKLPPRAYARVYGYLERMRSAGVPEEMVDESERLMAVPVFSKLNKRDVRERSEDDLIMDIDAAWSWIVEVVKREWGIKL